MKISEASPYRVTGSLGVGILPGHGGGRAGRPDNLALGRTRDCTQGIVDPLVCDHCHCSLCSAPCFWTETKSHLRPLQVMDGGWKHRRVKLSYKEPLQHPQKEQRQYPRYSVEYAVRVSTDHRSCGFAMIADLSVKGCRVKGKTIVTPGDFGKLLINLPTGIHSINGIAHIGSMGERT